MYTLYSKSASFGVCKGIVGSCACAAAGQKENDVNSGCDIDNTYGNRL